MTGLPKFPSCRNCPKLQCYLKPTNEGEKRTEPLRRWSECVLNLDYEEQCLKNKWRKEFVAQLEDIIKEADNAFLHGVTKETANYFMARLDLAHHILGAFK